MSGGKLAGRHYAEQIGTPPFVTDRRIKCTPDNADVFFTDSRIAEARTLCRSCPLREDCLRWAVDGGISDGVWGGMTGEERNSWDGTQGLPAPVRRHPDRCGNGHVLDNDTIYYAPSRPTQWSCRQCRRDTLNRAYARTRAARAAAGTGEAA